MYQEGDDDEGNDEEQVRITMLFNFVSCCLILYQGDKGVDEGKGDKGDEGNDVVDDEGNDEEQVRLTCCLILYHVIHHMPTHIQNTAETYHSSY